MITYRVSYCHVIASSLWHWSGSGSESIKAVTVVVYGFYGYLLVGIDQGGSNYPITTLTAEAVLFVGGHAGPPAPLVMPEVTK